MGKTLLGKNCTTCRWFMSYYDEVCAEYPDSKDYGFCYYRYDEESNPRVDKDYGKDTVCERWEKGGKK